MNMELNQVDGTFSSCGGDEVGDCMCSSYASYYSD